jgi:hypothetical protein
MTADFDERLTSALLTRRINDVTKLVKEGRITNMDSYIEGLRRQGKLTESESVVALETADARRKHVARRYRVILIALAPFFCIFAVLYVRNGGIPALIRLCGFGVAAGGYAGVSMRSRAKRKRSGTWGEAPPVVPK